MNRSGPELARVTGAQPVHLRCSRPPKPWPPGATPPRSPACPARVEAVRVPIAPAVGRVTAESVWAERSSPAFDSAAMDGIAVRAADTVRATETKPVLVEPEDFEVVDTGDPMPVGYDAVVMREHVHLTPSGQAELRAAVPPTSTSARSARTSAPTSSCCPKATGSARSTSPPRPPPAPSS